MRLTKNPEKNLSTAGAVALAIAGVILVPVVLFAVAGVVISSQNKKIVAEREANFPQ